MGRAAKNLSDLARTYTTGRWKRGELCREAARDYGYTFDTLCASFGNRQPSSLGPKAIDRWLETIAGAAPSTRRNYLSRVRGFCHWLQAEGVIKRDPCAHVPRIPQPRRVPVTLNRDQVTALGSNLPDLRARVVVAVMEDVGARCVEMERLCVEDYDPDQLVLRLTGKAGHERVVPISRATGDLLDRYLDEHGVVGGPLIRSKVDPAQGLKAATYSHYVREWMIGAGVKRRAFDGRSAHGLRRTAGSAVMDACGDVQVVQALLGHAEISTTAKYYLRPVSIEQIRRAQAVRDQGGAVVVPVPQERSPGQRAA